MPPLFVNRYTALHGDGVRLSLWQLLIQRGFAKCSSENGWIAFGLTSNREL